MCNEVSVDAYVHTNMHHTQFNQADDHQHAHTEAHGHRKHTHTHTRTYTSANPDEMHDETLTNVTLAYLQV